jgi:hypothetical protein
LPKCRKILLNKKIMLRPKLDSIKERSHKLINKDNSLFLKNKSRKANGKCKKIVLIKSFKNLNSFTRNKKVRIKD